MKQVNEGDFQDLSSAAGDAIGALGLGAWRKERCIFGRLGDGAAEAVEEVVGDDELIIDDIDLDGVAGGGMELNFEHLLGFGGQLVADEAVEEHRQRGWPAAELEGAIDGDVHFAQLVVQECGEGLDVAHGFGGVGAAGGIGGEAGAGGCGDSDEHGQQRTLAAALGVEDAGVVDAVGDRHGGMVC